jgi:hypothetical protein
MLSYQREVESGAAMKEEVGGAIEYLAALEAKLRPDVLATELPPYRRILSVIQRRMDNPLPIIYFESVRFLYIYPFTSNILPDDAAYKQLINVLVDRRNSSSSSPIIIAGVAAGPAKPARMTDLWSWGLTSEDEDLPIAIDISMPDLTVETQEGNFINDYQVLIRITRRGQHYVRIQKDLHHAKLHQINQGLRRPSVFMGREKIYWKDDAPRNHLTSENSKVSSEYRGEIDETSYWSHLWECAHEITLATSQYLEIIANTSNSSNESSSMLEIDGGLMDDLMVEDSAQEFHTIFEIRSAITKKLDRGLCESSREEILNFAAPLLFQPLDRLAVAPEEWMCYNAPGEMQNLIEDDSFKSDLLMSRGGTTVFYLPATPDWLVKSYEEAIEFVVSLPSHSNLWNSELEFISDNADDVLVQIQHDEDGHERSREIFTSMAKLAYHRRLLERVIDDKQKRRTTLTIPSKLTGPANQAKIVKNLLEVVKISDSVKLLDAGLERANIVHERILEHGRHLRDALDRRYQNTLQLILLFVGLFSFAGVISLIEQEAFGTNEDSYHHGAVWRDMDPGMNLIMTSLIYFGVLVIGVTLVWWARYKVRRYEKMLHDMQFSPVHSVAAGVGRESDQHLTS